MRIHSATSLMTGTRCITWDHYTEHTRLCCVNVTLPELSKSRRVSSPSELDVCLFISDIMHRITLLSAHQESFVYILLAKHVGIFIRVVYVAGIFAKQVGKKKLAGLLENSANSWDLNHFLRCFVCRQYNTAVQRFKNT